MKRALYDQSGYFLAAHSLILPEPTEYQFSLVEDDLADTLSNHHRFVAGEWVKSDPRTLDDLKATQWTQIKQARTQAEYAGFTWDGSPFDSDAISQNRITGAVALAQMAVASGAPFTIDWTLADNSTRTLSGMDMMQVGVSLGGHVQTQFAKGVLLRAQIDAATTQAEVEAVLW